jgi:hypothetical protein
MWGLWAGRVHMVCGAYGVSEPMKWVGSMRLVGYMRPIGGTYEMCGIHGVDGTYVGWYSWCGRVPLAGRCPWGGRGPLAGRCPWGGRGPWGGYDPQGVLY